MVDRSNIIPRLFERLVVPLHELEESKRCDGQSSFSIRGLKQPVDSTTTTKLPGIVCNRTRRRPSDQEIVDRLVHITRHKTTMNQKDMEIIAKVTYRNPAAKAMVAQTQTLIPRMIDSYIHHTKDTLSIPPPSFSSSFESSSGYGGDNQENHHHHHSHYHIPGLSAIVHSFSSTDTTDYVISEQELSTRKMTCQFLLVFCKALESCVTNCVAGSIQCRDPNLYRALLYDLGNVTTHVDDMDTRHTIVAAVIHLLCVLCRNDNQNAKHLKSIRRERKVSLRSYVAGYPDLVRQVSFLESFSSTSKVKV